MFESLVLCSFCENVYVVVPFLMKCYKISFAAELFADWVGEFYLSYVAMMETS